MSLRIPLLLALVCLLQVAAVGAPAQGAELPSAAHTLASCVRDSGRLLVAVEVDRSKSLRRTDPDDRRVDGISAALIGLEQLATDPALPSPLHVEVLLGSFAGSATPSTADAAGRWRTLDAGSLDALLRQADAYGQLDGGRDTDYALALIAAHAALEARAHVLARSGPAPCKAILFLSDGRYQLTARHAGGSLPINVPYATDVQLDVPGGPAQAVRAGRELLCRRGGLMDRIVADDTVMFTVALSSAAGFRPADRDFLHALTAGASGTASCGERVSPLTGWFLDVRDTLHLFLVMSNLLGGAPSIDGSSVCSTPVGTDCRTFDVVRGMSGFVLVASAPQPGLRLTITSPDGERVTISPATAGRFILSGAAFVQRWIRGRSLELQARFVGPPHAWAGPWRIAFSGPADTTLPAPPLVDVRLEAGLHPAVVGTPEVRRDEVTTIPVELVDQHGEPVHAGSLVDNAALSAWLTREGHAPLPLAVRRQGGGRFAIRVAVPAGFDARHVQIQVETRFSLKGAVDRVLGALRVPLKRTGPGLGRLLALLASLLVGIPLIGFALTRAGVRIPLPSLPRLRAPGRARFTPPQRLRVLELEAEIDPGRLVSFRPDPPRVAYADFEPLASEGTERPVRRLEPDGFALVARGGPLRRGEPHGEATAAEDRQLVGGTLGGPARSRKAHRVCDVPLAPDGLWLFAVDELEEDERVRGRLLLLVDDQEPDRGERLLREARTGLLAQTWQGFEERAEDGRLDEDDDGDSEPDVEQMLGGSWT